MRGPCGSQRSWPAIRAPEGQQSALDGAFRRRGTASASIRRCDATANSRTRSCQRDHDRHHGIHWTHARWRRGTWLWWEADADGTHEEEFCMSFVWRIIPLSVHLPHPSSGVLHPLPHSIYPSALASSLSLLSPRSVSASHSANSPPSFPTAPTLAQRHLVAQLPNLLHALGDAHCASAAPRHSDAAASTADVTGRTPPSRWMGCLEGKGEGDRPLAGGSALRVTQPLTSTAPSAAPSTAHLSTASAPPHPLAPHIY
ncbi:hypothetical protein DFH09DRAFT_499556 [Mycena vulgaris]|nr:hypothetical protein DFH09DRAFT_499556 [Mycena vulgaris]